jgi:hypothetical protein
MKHLLFFIVFLFVACAAPLEAQDIYTPERGSAERRTLLDTIRANAGSELRIDGTIEFYNVSLRVTGDWAMANVQPRRPGGEEIGHCFNGEQGYSEGDANIIALLYRSEGRWHVIESSTCATDVWYLHWSDKYGMPYQLGLPAPAPFPRTGVVSWPDDGFLSLRTEPSISRGQRITKMSGGSDIRVLECQPLPEMVEGKWGRWCRVRYDGQQGWAFSAYFYMD